MKQAIHSRSAKNQLGMTLVEIIAALAIVAAVIVGALALFDNASSSQHASQFYTDVQALRVASQQMFAGAGSYAALDNPSLIAAHKVPANLPSSGSTIGTPFNGTVTVATHDASNNRLDIRVVGIPFDVCTQLLLATNAAWGSVTVNNNTISQFPIPPSLTVGATGCVAGFNNITWTSLN